MTMRTGMLLLAFLCLAVHAWGNEEADRKAYLAKRAAEKAAAEQAVKELTARDFGTLSAEDFIRLALAYNELSDHPMALDAVCRVGDDVLAKKNQLELKAICFQNVNSGDDKSARLRELAFIDRCLDKKYSNQGVWLWRKAKLICQASVEPVVLTVGDVIGSDPRIIDRQQYDYSFELLQRAFEVEPKLYDLAGVAHQFMWSQDFPLLSEEERFEELMRRHAPAKK